MMKAVFFCVLALTAVSMAQVANPVALVAPWTVQPWITVAGLADDIEQVFGTAWDQNGNFYVADSGKGCLLKFPSSAFPINTNVAPAGYLWRVCYGASQPNGPYGAASGVVIKNNRLYLTNNHAPSDIWEVDMASGATIRQIGTMPGSVIAVDLHTDPLSGDVFTTSSDGIWRIQNIEGTPIITPYGSNRQLFDGFTFGPDGTIYGVLYNSQKVLAIQGTNYANPTTIDYIANTAVLAAPDGSAVCAGAGASKLVVDSNYGYIIQKDLATGQVDRIVDHFYGKLDLANTGPDSALYITQHNGNTNTRLWRLFSQDCKFVVTPPQQCPNQALPEGGAAVAPFAAAPVASHFVGEPVGITFDAQLNTYIVDYQEKCVYKFNAVGGKISINNDRSNSAWRSCPGTFVGLPAGVAVTSDGKLWLVTHVGYIYQVNPADGSVALKSTTPAGFYDATYDLKVDPIQGDLFFAAGNNVFRGTNWGTGTPTVSLYASVPSSFGTTFDGIGFSKDGTLYGRLGRNIISIPYNNPAGVASVINNLPTPDGIGVAADDSYILVNDNNGQVYKIDLTVPFAQRTAQSVFSGGTRGDTATVGPDGCFYITQSFSVVRLTTEPDCTCKLTPIIAPPPNGACPDCVGAHFKVGNSCTSSSKHSDGNCVTIEFSGTASVC